MPEPISDAEDSTMTSAMGLMPAAAPMVNTMGATMGIGCAPEKPSRMQSRHTKGMIRAPFPRTMRSSFFANTSNVPLFCAKP